MTKRPITERMAEAAAAMTNDTGRHYSARVPRVFFLSPEDYAEFMATNPPMQPYPTYYGGRPITLETPSFNAIAVRERKAQSQYSNLFSCAGTTKGVARE